MRRPPSRRFSPRPPGIGSVPLRSFPARVSLRPETSCAGRARPTTFRRGPQRGHGGASRGEGSLCLRRVGGAQSGAQVLLGVISAVTASRGTWAGPVPPCTLLGWSRRGGRWPTASTRPITFRSRPQRRLHGEACGEGTSCLGRADGAHSSSQVLVAARSDSVERRIKGNVSRSGVGNPLRSVRALHLDHSVWPESCPALFVEAPSAAEALRRSLDLHPLGDWTDDDANSSLSPRMSGPCRARVRTACRRSTDRSPTSRVRRLLARRRSPRAPTVAFRRRRTGPVEPRHRLESDPPAARHRAEQNRATDR